MRIRLSNRWAVFGAVCAVATALSASQVPVATTFASHPAALTSSDFHQVAAQGFGDRSNSWPWGSAYYNGRVYIGTDRDYGCAVQGSLHVTVPFLYAYPGPLAKDPDLSCPPTVAKIVPDAAAQIWSVDPSISANQAITQSNWRMDYQSPATQTVTVLKATTINNAPRDMGYRMMLPYPENGGESLYVSGASIKPLVGSNSLPPALLRSTDGQNFQPVPADPGTTMGDINTLPGIPELLGKGACCFRNAVSYHGKFYIVLGNFEGGGALFMSPNPSAGDNSFQQVTPTTMTVYEAQVFNDHLYLGLQSRKDGYTVVEANDSFDSCTGDNTNGCPASDFSAPIIPLGGGLGTKGDFNVVSMYVYTSTSQSANGPVYTPHLYVGTDGSGNHRAAELVRINPDNSWDLIVGKPRQYTVNGQTIQKNPLSGIGQGFDWPFNVHMWRMATYQGNLYVGTFDASTNQKDTILGPLLKPFMGFDLWASPDGVTFRPVTITGFKDMFTSGVRALVPTPYGLFVGGINQWYGLRIFEGQPSASAQALAPTNLQADSAGGGAVALSWDAPSQATVFHVYRSEDRHVTLPPPAAYLDPESDTVVPQGTEPVDTWLPGADTEIGTTSDHYFVDRTAQPGGHYSYYVVAGGGATGQQSEQSNEATVPVLATTPTFAYLRGVVSYLLANGKLSSATASQVNSATTLAAWRLRFGNASGAVDTLATLQQQLLNEAHQPVDVLYAQQLDYLLGRLQKRVALVAAHVLQPWMVR